MKLTILVQPGIGHNHIQPPHLVDRLFDQGLDARARSHVCLDAVEAWLRGFLHRWDGFAFPDELVRLLGPGEVVHDDTVGGRQGLDDGGAEAG